MASQEAITGPLASAEWPRVSGEQLLEIRFFAKKSSFSRFFKILLLPRHPHCGHYGWREGVDFPPGARQEVVGHRSTRFRACRHPQSGPGLPGNDFGKFYFQSKNHHFP